MNSDQERQLFESWGWTRDYAHGEWVSPSGCWRITADELVLMTGTPAGELVPRGAIASHGKVSEDRRW